jgi:glycosyltransferase involved in cell wall biosynthesis
VRHDLNGLLVPPGDPAALAAAIATLANEPERRRRFARTNRALVRQRFSWREVARRYEAIFAEALEGKRAPDAVAPATLGALAGTPALGGRVARR